MNRPARFTTADLVRATKAAEKVGPDWAVEIDLDGTIRIVRRAGSRAPTATHVAPVEDVVF